MYINPETVSGIAISLQIVFAVIAGGMFVQLGPTVGALITLLLAESLRVLVGHEVHGLDGTIYGLMLVLFIIYMPKGILGQLLELWNRRRPGGAARPPAPGREGLARNRNGRADLRPRDLARSGGRAQRPPAADCHANESDVTRRIPRALSRGSFGRQVLLYRT